MDSNKKSWGGGVEGVIEIFYSLFLIENKYSIQQSISGTKGKWEDGVRSHIEVEIRF